MKYCKNCGVLYSTEVCPKCGIEMPKEPETPREMTEEDKKKQKKDWIALLIGIPAFIGIIYLVIWLYTSLTR